MKNLALKKIIAMTLVIGAIAGQNVIQANALTSPQSTKVAVTAVPQRDVFALVKPSIVYATMLWSEGGFAKGQKVEIIMDTGNGTDYKVTANGRTGWVSGRSVSIPKDPATNMDKLTQAEKERYVNGKGFSSKSKYFVWVDIDRQELNVFTGARGSWKLYSSFSCSTGTNKTPTLRGSYTLQDRGPSFGSYNSLGAKYWVRYSGSYLIHSLPYQYGKIADYTLGKRASHGCVRIAVDKAQWIYNTLPSGTTIWTN